MLIKFADSSCVDEFILDKDNEFGAPRPLESYSEKQKLLYPSAMDDSKRTEICGVVAVGETQVPMTQLLKLKSHGVQHYVQWEGRVIERYENGFVAHVELKEASLVTRKFVKINTSKVSIVNGEFLSDGASFYWTIGLFPDSKGTLYKRSEVCFQRISRMRTEDILADVESHLANLLEGIEWLE